MIEKLFFIGGKDLCDDGLVRRANCVGFSLESLTFSRFYITHSETSSVFYTYSPEFMDKNNPNHQLVRPFITYPAISLYEAFVNQYNKFSKKVSTEVHNTLVLPEAVKNLWDQESVSLDKAYQKYEVSAVPLLFGPMILVWIHGDFVYIKWDPTSYHGQRAEDWWMSHEILEIPLSDYEVCLQRFRDDVASLAEIKIKALCAVNPEFGKLSKEVNKLPGVKSKKDLA